MKLSEITEQPVKLSEIKSKTLKLSDLDRPEYNVWGRLFTPISKQVTGKSLGERTDLLNRTAKFLTNKAVGVGQTPEGTFYPKPKMNLLDFYIAQTPAATAQTAVNLVDVSPADIGLAAITAGLSKTPIGQFAGQAAKRVPVGKGFVNRVKELGKLEKALKPYAGQIGAPKLIAKPLIAGKAAITSKYANNINLSHLPEEIQQPIIQFITDNPVVGKTPKITNAEVIRRVAEIKETPTMRYLEKIMTESPEGQFPVLVNKLRQGYIQNVVDVLKSDLTDFKSQIDNVMTGSLEKYRKLGAETGRALQSMGLNLKTKENVVSLINSKIGQIKKDPLFKDNKVLIEGLEQLKQEIGGKEFNPSNWDKLYKLWLEMMLSDPRTHIGNTASNTMFALSKIPEKFFQALVDVPISMTTGKRSAYFGEIPAMIQGIFSSKRVPIPLGNKAEGIAGKGMLRFTPLELLRLEDNLGKGLVGKMEKYALAYRQGVAMRKGYRGLPATAKIAQEQLIRTFQNEPGRIAQALMSLRDKIPGARYIIPFVKTPANILDRAVERTPIGIYALRNFKNMSQSELSERLGLITMGTLASVWIAKKVIDGQIVGEAPGDRAERDDFYRSGKQPNSIKVFNKWIPFDRLEPLGTSMALIANLIQSYIKSDKDLPSDKIMDAVLPIGSNLVNKTYMQGLSNLIKAISEPEIYGARWGQRILAGFASPGLLNYIAQLKDPYIRYPTTAAEIIQSRMPGLSQQVRPRLTAFGEQIERATPYLPIRVSEETQNPVEKELDRLQLFVSFPAKTIKGQKLNPDEYNKYLKTAGQTAKKALGLLFVSPEYQSLDEQGQVKLVEKIIERTRETPRKIISFENALRELNKATKEQKIVEIIEGLPQYTQERLFKDYPKYLKYKNRLR